MNIQIDRWMTVVKAHADASFFHGNNFDLQRNTSNSYEIYEKFENQGWLLQFSQNFIFQFELCASIKSFQPFICCDAQQCSQVKYIQDFLLLTLFVFFGQPRINIHLRKKLINHERKMFFGNRCIGKWSSIDIKGIASSKDSFTSYKHSEDSSWGL